MNPEPSEPEIVHAAIDALLLVVGRSADDLLSVPRHGLEGASGRSSALPACRCCHDTQHYRAPEEGRGEVAGIMIALGLAHSPRQPED